MKALYGIRVVIISLVWSTSLHGGSPKRVALLSEIETRGHYVVFDVNNISTHIRNTGSINRNPAFSNSTFEWPKGSDRYAFFASGIWLSGKVAGSTRSSITTYQPEFDAGPIRPGVNPRDMIWRAYKLRKGDDVSSNPDFASWPHREGAPFYVRSSGDTLPHIIGDMTAWAVFNDTNDTLHNLTNSTPMGIEIQMTAYAFDRNDYLGDAIFYTWKMTNKSNTPIDSMFFSIWSDADLGDPQDDLLGCDTLRALGYTYNDGPDAVYGTVSPATGFVFLQGPLVQGAPNDTARFPDCRTFPGKRAIGMSSFLHYSNDTIRGDPRTPEEAWNLQRCRDRQGNAVLDNNGQPTTYMFPGDPGLPLSSTNWIEPPGSGGDRRFLMSTGPFSMEAGETQEVVAANIIAQGSSAAGTIIEIRRAAIAARSAYESNLGYEIPDDSPPQTPLAFRLDQNYPNPFNPGTTIRFGIPIRERVALSIFDVLGREVATLVDQELSEGEHTVRWDGTSEQHTLVPSGVYFYRLEFRGHTLNRNMLLLR